ncbi:MAG: GCN5-related N-acetyltransferase [Brevundimonas sp.]|nr:GCN5-related N-acetyltransferase [Brevundimonas sp.]
MISGIRTATPNDAEAVIALWTASGLTRPWNDPRADFDLALKTPTSTILIAGEGRAVDGSVMVGFDGHRGWVYYLAVDPQARRRGLGRSLMRAAEHWLRAQGASKIQLMVRADNAEALAFHHAIGLEDQAVSVLGRRLNDEAGSGR